MQSAKTIVAGLIIGGAGVAVRAIGDAIFTATGTSTGPVVNYGTLMETASLVLFGLGGVFIAVGVVTGLYAVLQSDETEGDEDREEARSSGSRTAPSSQQGRPRNRRRS